MIDFSGTTDFQQEDRNALDSPPSAVNCDKLAGKRVSYLPQRQRMAA